MLAIAIISLPLAFVVLLAMFYCSDKAKETDAWTI